VQILIEDGLQNVAAWGGMSEGVPKGFSQSPSLIPIPTGSLTSHASRSHPAAASSSARPPGSNFFEVVPSEVEKIGIKQRAGPNCTCSFRECVGTVCFSLGSSRLCKMETLIDEFSHLKPCVEGECEARTETVWLHSGSSMYFNAEWNSNHNHGIPKMETDCGPRISIAYLMGAK